MARIYAIVNQKGGVGKTTTTVSLAAALAAFEQSVLLVDLDPQGNATTASGQDKHEIEAGTVEVLLGEQEPAAAVRAMSPAGYDLLASNEDLTAAEVELIQSEDRFLRLKQALDGIAAYYDYILIDCPPSLGMLTLNALTAADGVIVPLQCEFFALEGLSAITRTVERVRETLNPDLALEGVLRTMFDPRNRLASEVSEQLTEHFAGPLYQTVIPRNVRLAEAPSHGLPVIHYDPSSRGSYAYMDLAAEILERHDQLSEHAVLEQATRPAAAEEREPMNLENDA